MKSLRVYSKSRFEKGSSSIAPAICVLLFSVTFSVVNADGNFEPKNINQVHVPPYNVKIKNDTFQGNASIIKQIGNNNYASVVQSYSSAYQFANFAYIYQKGDRNQARISQVNGNNIGIILQAGSDHDADIVQKGNNFQAKINQVGFGSDTTLSQSGSGQQRISVEQQNYSGNALPVAINTY